MKANPANKNLPEFGLLAVLAEQAPLEST